MVAPLAALLAALTVTLGPNGVGKVHFGLTKTKAVAALTQLFGPPTSRGPNTGCRPRYTEVVWGGLSAEFRVNVFSGYRYRGVKPKLATATGISLGNTLAQVRAAYGKLVFVGTDRWRAPNGLVFYDNAMHDPEPPSSRIVEIKIGTCGDF
ncbi:MAG TPA: hypothetical protein VNC40_01940 [Gaiellaceae bacterium]|nr:hypothetical protein [Gaiellaceae bacterium]